jgi:hypothetical protein
VGTGVVRHVDIVAVKGSVGVDVGRRRRRGLRPG